MRATEVIEAFIDDTVRLLPRRQRDDVAKELRSLLNEDLQARAQESGRPPDEALAVSLVQAHGRPNEAAARYQQAWAIIEPADTRNFLRAAFLGIGTLIVLSVLSALQPAPAQSAADWVKNGTFVWLGVLVVVFGTRSWIRSRWPARLAWKPRDRDAVSRVGVAALTPFALAGMLIYAAPIWVLDQISGGRIQTEWATYTENFQRRGLPLFIGMLGVLLALEWYAACQGRRTRRLRRVGIALNLALACLALAQAVNGDIFQSSAADQMARNVLGAIGAIYLPCVAVMLYNEIGRQERFVGATSSLAGG